MTKYGHGQEGKNQETKNYIKGVYSTTTQPPINTVGLSTSGARIREKEDGRWTKQNSAPFEEKITSYTLFTTLKRYQNNTLS